MKIVGFGSIATIKEKEREREREKMQNVGIA
jgi:hypothetical protein